jgi:hypothetical protein
MTTEVPPRSESRPEPQQQAWPEWVYPYSAGIAGGLLGGAAVALVGLVYGLYSGYTWLPVNAVAATVLRDLQLQSLQQLSQFNMAALLTGLVLHGVLSVSLGMAFAFILPGLPGRPVYWGPVIGPLLLVGATIVVLPLINPVMAASIEWVSFGIANVLYGLILGWWIDRTPLIYVGE